ncbi:conserved hypothetical protein [Verticillium alfalfae VaMs.102]|uniref:Uncharacterized protein n=1 Tax=Verticillium alfalfae (strain VaMs.102 / ATCC MYA-4576 / FGSC 10136) TaxID=526221 RepID=C9S5C2_VERA1|nr:conserved hypothetical protein [Verticillium alfalfae VaMs.102]EEY15030.1 conserved hypothetical protein [Verticillium alfalfae VaMs.102]
MAVLTHLLGLGLGLIQLAAAAGIDDSLPSYHYGAPIQVECMNRSSAPPRKRLVIGDPLPLSFSVRWFPTPALPKTEGTVEWQGMGGHIYASTVFYSIVSFGAGVTVAGAYFLGVVLPKRLKNRTLGGATPLGYGVNGVGVGNGWGYSKTSKRLD